MRPKGLIRLLLTGCLLLLLSGCTFGATVDALLTPPHLRGEQEQIYQALENAVGNRITLQYPRSGDHLSAVMISDLDGDGQDEAAVFYRKESSLSTENALRLNLLDQADGTWMSVCDLPAEGAEVDRGFTADIGGRQRLIIGYSQVDNLTRHWSFIITRAERWRRVSLFRIRALMLQIWTVTTSQNC